MLKFVSLIFAVLLLSACGKEAPPKWVDEEGKAVPANSYPPAYDAQIGN